MNDAQRSCGLDVIFIDNFDSFVFNLVDEFARRRCSVEVWRSDIDAGRVLELADRKNGPCLVVLSPGPGAPADAGCCMELVKKAPVKLPVFGVCLGFQVMVEAFGGKVGPAQSIVHGKTSEITHEENWLFEGLGPALSVGRYHSLAAVRMPDSMRVTAGANDTVMAAQHKEKMAAGVQFHPESILTSGGGRMIENVIRWAQSRPGSGEA